MKKITLIVFCLLTITIFALKEFPSFSNLDWKEKITELFSVETELYSSSAGRFSVFRDNGKISGFYIVTDEVSSPVGYQGKTRLGIKLDIEQKIVSIDMLKTAETPAFVKRIVKKKYFDLFTGKIYSDSFDVKYISGATMTSKAMKISIEESMKAYKPVLDTFKTGTNLESQEISKL